MFQHLKKLENNDYLQNVWFSARIKELVDGGMKKKEAVAVVSKESKNKPWEKKND